MSAPTLRNVAKQLGLGKSTVQRALTGSTSVSEETRRRVLEAAEQIGYRRDVYFATLSAHRKTSGKVTLPVHFLFGSPVNPNFHQGHNCYPGLNRQGEKKGYEVHNVTMEEFTHWQSMLRILYHRGSRGLLVEQIDPVMHELLRNFDLLPVVCCERQEGLGFHTVRYGVGERVRMCWAKLWQAGYRRIGFALHRHGEGILDDRDRLGAALTLLHDVRVKDRVPPLENLNDVFYREWLASHKPDAVISFNPGCWYKGMDHPNRPKALVSLHASPKGKAIHHVPGAASPADVFASEVIVLLDRLVRFGEMGRPAHPIDVVIPPVWHEGAGIPPAA